MNTCKIKSIKKITIKNNRYDITVDDFSCYFANDILIHNTDGQNLMFSWIDDKLKVARNGSHLKNFGKNALDINGISSMFSGRGEIHTAFVEATRDLESAISKLSQKQKDKIFANGKKFMSVEVIYPATTNVIPYGMSMLIFHGTREYDESGNIIGADKSDATLLTNMIKQVNADVQNTFKIKPPNDLKLPKVQNFKSQQGYFLSKLNKLQSEFGLSDSDKVSEYHRAWWEKFINDNAKKLKYVIPYTIVTSLIKRWAYGDKSTKIPELKSQIDNDKFKEWVNNFDKQSYTNQLKINMSPFEKLFLELAAKVLENISTFLAINPDTALSQIKSGLNSAISRINSSNNIKDINLLNTQLERLNALGGENAIIPSEGITFMYNGKLYKLTGAFAPLNMIMGIGRF